MKNYRETYIRKAEIAQLIILQQLFMQKDSHRLIFQGGTAIRWCYGGSRFSEDLDFVTPFAPAPVRVILKGAVAGIEKLMIPHFGVGSVSVTEKKTRADTLKCFVDFRPASAREKISIKLEFEGLVAEKFPDVKNHVLSSLSAVTYLMAAGAFLVPRPHTVIVAETPDEILSDKIRSLLERRYLKGRDFFDLWYLHVVLRTAVDVEIVRRKFGLYRETFVPRRGMAFFTKPSGEEEKMMREAIEQDLARFLPPEALAVHRAEKYNAFLETVRSLFNELQTQGVRLP